MLQTIKRRLYFLVARYFLFWAKIQILIWHPKVIVVTGSSGKTTTMHLLESQLGDSAHYSHHANSVYGISFDILGLKRETLLKSEWVKLFMFAPFKSLKKPFIQNTYIAEVDCDRPREGKMIARLLKPQGVIWLSSGKTHSMNFEEEVRVGAYKNVETAIAHAFSEVARAARNFVIINNDSKLMLEQIDKVKAKILTVSLDDLTSYLPNRRGTIFKGKTLHYNLSALVPKEVFYSLEAVRIVCELLDVNFDQSFKRFNLPPGRSSILNGVKNTTIIDSSYNSSADALEAMVDMYKVYDAKNKWLVIGDILEQGSDEGSVHKSIATIIKKSDVDQVILIGPRLIKYTLPELRKHALLTDQIEYFEQPKDALVYISEKITGGETILFKGARFLEGVIEHLLKDKKDAAKLCRRELVWQQRRKKWGL